MDHDTCVKTVETLLKEMNTLRYLTESMAALGRHFDATMVKCVKVEEGTGADAGYLWEDRGTSKRGEIVVHENMVNNAQDVEILLRHELIHAYDDTRAVIEPTNCYHHACSEVRAARMSGECMFSEELKRGNISPVTAGMTCVRRRAGLAVSGNPFCRGIGDRAVEKVFPACYKDYEPFVAPLFTLGEYPT